jgi:hypothetical protein
MYLILELATPAGVLVFLAAGLFAATTLAVLTIASAQAVYAKSSRFISSLETAVAELRWARALLPSRRPE